MGNSLGGKKTTKVMKIDGQTMKFKTPAYAGEIVRNYPGHVLLDSEAVKHFGIRAKPLEPQQELRSKRLYFLVEIPKVPEERTPRRVRSGTIQMSAKDRLESLMLSRRSSSDLSSMNPSARFPVEAEKAGASENGGVRLKLRLPKVEVEKLMMECKDEEEATAKLMQLCMAGNGSANKDDHVQTAVAAGCSSSDQGRSTKCSKLREKRVGFLPINQGEIHQLAVAS
ncbi:unnamed protein product [Cuscuta epithymum]|uniref:Plastid movement impaired 2 n=1 Tax=Cuscuta epithymum TaxID=186058 RepID=A0AAV0GFG4_9ASTE|nr:unnamed protein product [Cuscuta epithymum]